MEKLSINQLEKASHKPLIRAKFCREVGTIESIVTDEQSSETIVNFKTGMAGYPLPLFYENEEFELVNMSG